MAQSKLRVGAWTAVAFSAGCFLASAAWAQPLPGGTQDPMQIPKYVTKLVAPPQMPPSTSDASVNHQIAVRQFQQQILPPGFPRTTVWSYGSIDHPGAVAEGGSFNYPAFTIEATAGTALKVKWINDLKDGNGNFLPHLLPVDQTLHWANPPQMCDDGTKKTDCRGFLDGAYTGPVPIVTHLHGSHVDPESDGYPEAWYLPAANNVPGGYATRGSHFGQVAGSPEVPGQAIFNYRNDQRATTLWYHDHTLGITRLNVYAGPAGFYLLRGGPGDVAPGTLPGPAPGVGADPFGKYYEIPIVVQDRSFNSDGSLFYPGTRRFFDGYTGPFIPTTDISPKWNPETFGNTMVVNGRTWPYLEVEPRRYRFRFLNGCNARFLILTTQGPALTFWRIGADGGFLPAPLPQTQLLLGPAERADVVVDFTEFATGTSIDLLNIGPDEPFGGGVPGVDFASSDPGTTGQVMRFKVVPLASVDSSTRPSRLRLPAPASIGASTTTRRLSLNEASSRRRCLSAHGYSVPCLAPGATEFGPIHSMLGPVDGAGFPVPTPWENAITENPALGATETWEMYNFTADAHPIHIHLVQFQILDRQPLVTDSDGITAPPVAFAGAPRPPEAWETGRKDTVIVFPGEVARVKAVYDIPGLYVWHCHILEHEDNEMMRPYRIGP